MYLSDCLKSILYQSHKNLEILICDDCSTDGTNQIIKDLSNSRIKNYLYKDNLGYLNTCNNLFAEATGEYIGFQDADDVSNLKRIEKQVSYLFNNPEVKMCGTNFFRKNDSNSKIVKSDVPLLQIDVCVIL